eukprot:GEMP01002201.1.p1 GENE.GEMP01002201.1~~GEMP01002201.1.p1  ORF type:complete len:1080 (+),score=415.91 GEMP01002201.1:123-3362(+)
MNAQLIAAYSVALTGWGAFFWPGADRHSEHAPQASFSALNTMPWNTSSDDISANHTTRALTHTVQQHRRALDEKQAHVENERAVPIEDSQKRLDTSDAVVAERNLALRDCEAAKDAAAVDASTALEACVAAKDALDHMHTHVLEDKRASDERLMASVTTCEQRNHQLRKESKDMRINYTRDAETCRTRADTCVAELGVYKSSVAKNTKESEDLRAAGKWNRELIQMANKEVQKKTLALEKIEADKERAEEENLTLQTEKERVERENRSLRTEKERVEVENMSLQREKEHVESLRTEKKRVEEDNRSLRTDKERVEVENRSLQNEIAKEKERSGGQGLKEGAAPDGGDGGWWIWKDRLLMLLGFLFPLLYKRKELATLNNRLRAAEAEKESSNEAVTMMKNALLELQGQMVEKETRLHTQSNAFNELKDQEIKRSVTIDDLEDKVQHKSQREHDLQNAVASLKLQLAEKSDEAASEEVKMAEVNDKLSSKLLQYQKRHASLEAQVREAQSEVASLRTDIQHFETKLDEARHESASLRTPLQVAQEALQVAQEQRASLDTQICAARCELASSQEAHQAAQDERASLEAQMLQSETEHASTITKIESAAKEHRAALTEMALQMDNLQVEQSALQDTLAEKRAAHEEDVAKLKELQLLLDTADGKVTKQEQQFAEKQLKLDAFEADMEERAMQLEKLQGAYDESQNAMADIKRKEAAQEKKCKDLINLLEQEADVRKLAEEQVAVLEEEVVAKGEIVGQAALAVTLERQYNESQETIAALTAQLHEHASLDVARQHESIAWKQLHAEEMEKKKLELQRLEAKLAKAIRVKQDLEAALRSERDDQAVLAAKFKEAQAEKAYAESQLRDYMGQMQEFAEKSSGDGQPCAVEYETEETNEGTKDGEEEARANKEDTKGEEEEAQAAMEEKKDEAAAPIGDTDPTAATKKINTEEETRAECNNAHSAELPRGGNAENPCDDMPANDWGEKEGDAVYEESQRVITEQHSSSTDPAGAESPNDALREKSENALQSPDAHKMDARKTDMPVDTENMGPSAEHNVDAQDSPLVNKDRKKKKNKKSGGQRSR